MSTKTPKQLYREAYHDVRENNYLAALADFEEELTERLYDDMRAAWAGPNNRYLEAAIESEHRKFSEFRGRTRLLRYALVKHGARKASDYKPISRPAG